MPFSGEESPIRNNGSSSVIIACVIIATVVILTSSKQRYGHTQDKRHAGPSQEHSHDRSSRLDDKPPFFSKGKLIHNRHFRVCRHYRLRC